MQLTDKQRLALYQIVSSIKEGDTEITLGGYAGTGKAQPLYSLVATPNGFVTMGDIKVGDVVSTPSGRNSKVSGVFPQGIKSIYRIWFSDGHSVECCDDHLWKVIDRRRLSNLKKYKTPYKICPLSYIRDFCNRKDGTKRFYIETTEPVQFTQTDVPVNPYFIGLMLGDGSIGDNNFAIHTDDCGVKVPCEWAISKFDCHLEHRGGVTYDIVGDEGRGPWSKSVELRNCFRELGLWNTTCHTKFIPQLYLHNSVDVRLAVLQGLMDTDGTVDHRSGMASLTTTSPKLASDICFLVESLGGICRIKPKKPKCRYKGEISLGKDAFELNIGFNDTPSLFRLDRKKELAKPRTKYKTRRCIRSVEYVGEEQCQCIMIDDPDHLYLTNHFVATHNTTLINYLTKFYPNFGVCAYTGKAANVLRKKGIHSATTIHSRIYKPFFDNGVVYFDLTDDPNCDGFIVDEASMVSSDIYEDIKSFDMPMIYVGDHGQLEPIDSKFNLMENPRFRLEEIHRNAGPIARFAEHLRSGFNPRSFKEEGDQVVFVPKITDTLLLSVDQVICAFNKTRCETNNRIRKALGHTGVLNVGERVMCLKNNRMHGLFNGMQGTVVNLYRGPRGRKLMDFEFDGFIYSGIPYEETQFGREKYNFKYTGQDSPNPFDYAYCITAHKSQGDEWENVLVIEQRTDNWCHRRWSYTSASRSKIKLNWKMLS